MRAEYEIRDAVLHAVITGDYSAAHARQNKANIARLINESGVRRGLIDLRGAMITQSTIDIYEINSSIDGDIPRDVRFAFVYSPATFTTELAEFAENVLVNAGHDARVCVDPDEALRWVKGER